MLWESGTDEEAPSSSIAFPMDTLRQVSKERARYPATTSDRVCTL